MTRRPVKAGETACAFNPSRTTTRFVPGCRYVPGRDYAVQKHRGGHEVARIRILQVRLEQLGDITPADAIAEGFKTTDHFFAYWENLHGHVDRKQAVWVLTFRLTEAEPVRLLARRLGYTDKRALALEDEPEAVDEATQLRLTRQADEHKGQQALVNQARRERYELEQRLLRARSDARIRGVDISSPLRVIERQLAAIERRVYDGRAA